MLGLSLPRDAELHLGYFEPEDAEVVFAGDHDLEHRRRFELAADFVPSLQHASAVIEAWARDRRDGRRFAFAVRLHSGTLVGGCEVCEVSPPRAKVVNLSYWIYPPHRARGYARRAIRLICRWMRENTDFQLAEVVVDPDNLASRRAALGAGFTLAGQRGGQLLHVLDLVAGRADAGIDR